MSIMNENELPQPRVDSSPQSRRARGEALDLACTSLMQLARELGPNARMPGLRTLRAEIGVSQGTLNEALSRLEQRRVLLRRERSGVFVAPRIGQRNVCLICAPDFFLQSSVSPFWSLLVEQVTRLAEEHNTHLTIGFSHAFVKDESLRSPIDASPLPDYLRSEIKAGNFQGVIAIGLPHPTTRWIETQGVPVVAFAGAARYIVATSWLALINDGVSALMETGCRRVDLWLPPVLHWENNRALAEATFHRVLAIHGGTVGEIVAASATGRVGEAFQPPRIETGWEYAFKRLGPECDRPEGILIADDILTLGAMMAFPRLGLVLGREVQIATYANSGAPLLLGWQEKLYRIEYDLSELVERLLETLDVLMDHGPEAASGAFVPPFEYDVPEYEKPDCILERYRLVHPRLVRPTPDPE